MVVASIDNRSTVLRNQKSTVFRKSFTNFKLLISHKKSLLAFNLRSKGVLTHLNRIRNEPREPHQQLQAIVDVPINDRNMTKQDLRKATGLLAATIAKMGKEGNVTTDVLLRICQILRRQIGDTVEVIPVEEA